MKKILAIAPYNYLPVFSGGQKFIAQFFTNLARETSLTVIGTFDNDWSLAEGYRTIPLLKVSFSRYLDQSLVKKIVREIKTGSYDAIIWEHPYFAWLASRVKKQTGITSIIHTHNIEYQRFKSTGRWWWPILKRYERKAFRDADYLLFITPADREFAISQWKIESSKCIDVPFGVELSETPADREQSQALIAGKHGVFPLEKIILFNGLLNYGPNLDALTVILEKINPILLSRTDFRYKIIICGRGLPGSYTNLSDYEDKNIIYAGFVEDITTYLKGSDLFLNPVQSGGGIKTKMVEALAFGTTVVSTETGAAGIMREYCGDKLIVVPDNSWSTFANAVVENAGKQQVTPPEFYNYYNWSSITRNLLASLPDHSPGRPEKN